MTAQLALFAPTVMLSECCPGDTIRFPHQHLAMTLHQVDVIGRHVRVFGMWHPVYQPPPRYSPVATGSGGHGGDDQRVEIITPR